MTIYTDVFGGANIYPSDISYRAVSLTADVTLNWPDETSAATNFAARIMDVDASVASRVIILPDATEASTGETILFNAVGAETFIVKDAAGVQVVTIDSGEAWQIYLSDNTTAAGVWQTFQYGASVSNANASSLAGTGLIAVGAVLSQSVPVSELSSNYTAGTNDRAKMLLWSGAVGTLSLPDPASVGNNWFILIRNSGSGSITVDPVSSILIDGSSTKIYNPGESSIIATDGIAYYSIGYGKSATFAFDYTSIAVAGTGSYTLSGSELNRIAYKFTGLLTGARSIIVPGTVQQYWVDNSTTGAYTLTVKTAAGAGVVVAQGSRSIMYCNGSDVVDADTGSIATPIAISDGGTGATTANAALVNLGGTSVGVSLFTATDQAAAWSALGAPSVISGGTF